MGRILLWIAALVAGAGLLTALVIWLAPLVAALVVLYVAGKIVIFRAPRVHQNSVDKFIRPVDA
jgi:hypothetical protein